MLSLPGPGVHRSGSEPPGSSGGEKGVALTGQGCGACVLVTRTPNESSCFQPQLTREKQLESPSPERPASAHGCPVLKARSQRSWLRPRGRRRGRPLLASPRICARLPVGPAWPGRMRFYLMHPPGTALLHTIVLSACLLDK